MRREGRYWIFFVIIAVGLALSWGQVGRKTHQVFADSPVVLLATETPCRPLAAPCAAVGGDRALVAGPAGRGLAIRQAGLDGDQVVAGEAEFLDAEGVSIRVEKPAYTAGGWGVPFIPAGAAMLRFIVRDNRATTVAEYPLLP